MKTDRKKIAEYIYGELEEIRGLLEEIRDEEQESFDEMTERQQESKKGETLQEEIDNLDTAVCDLDDAVVQLMDYVEYIENSDSSDDEDENETEEYDDDDEGEFEDNETEAGTDTPMELAKKLNSNLQVMSNTFEVNGLQILSITCSPLSNSLAGQDADLKISVTLSAVPGLSKYAGKKLIVHLFDENGHLYLATSKCLSEIQTSSETVQLTCCGCGDVLYKVSSGKLFVSS